MRDKYMMKTYTALVSAKVGATTKLVRTEVSASNSTDAKWLLQAIYGFHAVASMPSEKREILTSEDAGVTAPSPDQQRIKSLQATKDRAADALKAERDRQKRQSALKTLRTI